MKFLGRLALHFIIRWNHFMPMAENSMLTEDQLSGYRWVMAAIAGLLMTTSFISLTAFGIMSTRMASAFGISSSTLSVYGIDAFSIGCS
jgi:hypothetical protein